MSTEEKLKLMPLSELMLWLKYFENILDKTPNGIEMPENFVSKLDYVIDEIKRRENNLFDGETRYQYRSLHTITHEVNGGGGWKDCSLDEYEKMRDLVRFEVREIKV